jgi:predicted transcriptional regulator
MKYTSEVFQRLSRGQFISSNSIDAETRAIYSDIEENQQEYEDYFSKIDFLLSSGDGFYYFSRKEAKVITENKLQSLFSWIDYLDFLKTYDITFSTGFQFRSTHILERINLDVELRDKARKLFRKQNTNQEVVEKLVSELTGMGFAEIINEEDDTYKVTAAFRYAEEMVNLITIYNEEEVPEV